MAPLLEPRSVLQLDSEARQHLVVGDILVLRRLAAVRALVENVAERCRRGLGTADPVAAHDHHGTAELARRCAALVGEVESDASIESLLEAALIAAGATQGTTYRDRLRFRIQTGHGDIDIGRSMTLPAHRDTWGSNALAQVNWWTPVFPVDAGRTICFWPDRFTLPVANTSAAWDYERLLACRRSGAPYPLLPEASADIPLADARPLVIAPGDLLAFSGAQLHAGVPNWTGLMRFSLEVRTVDSGDLDRGCGAPNVDGRAPRRPLHWFRRLGDRRSLAEH